MIKRLFLAFLLISVFSCTERKNVEANTDLMYFDIKGYFQNEIVRLQMLKPTVVKTVYISGSEEKKTIGIQDWNKELAIFLNADINKASWKGSFSIDKKDENEIYKSSAKKIPVKMIAVTKENKTVKKIVVIIAYKNILYQSQDTLTYYPDSLYEIKKEQDIRFLKKKKFTVIGKLK